MRPARATPSAGRTCVELLDAGINVYTTVNVQHVESLNDVVAQITGVVVRETVPDSVLEQADEVELIDLPPDDLLQRLRRARSTSPSRRSEAIENFFRKGNLIALRELALRRTAERVDAQMRAYMRDHAIARDLAGAPSGCWSASGPSPSSDPPGAGGQAHGRRGSARSGSSPTSRRPPSPACLRPTRDRRRPDAAAGRAARRRDRHR